MNSVDENQNSTFFKENAFAYASRKFKLFYASANDLDLSFRLANICEVSWVITISDNGPTNHIFQALDSLDAADVITTIMQIIHFYLIGLYGLVIT